MGVILPRQPRKNLKMTLGIVSEAATGQKTVKSSQSIMQSEIVKAQVNFNRPVKLVFKPTGGTIWQEVARVELAFSSLQRALVSLATLADSFDMSLHAGAWAVKQGRTVLVSRNSDTPYKWTVNTQKLQFDPKG